MGLTGGLYIVVTERKIIYIYKVSSVYFTTCLINFFAGLKEKLQNLNYVSKFSLFLIGSRIFRRNKQENLAQELATLPVQLTAR
jgi:hypothetical protein